MKKPKKFMEVDIWFCWIQMEGALTMTLAMAITRLLVAVKPRRPPKTNAHTETAFRHDHCKTRVHIQKVNISEVRDTIKVRV